MDSINVVRYLGGLEDLLFDANNPLEEISQLRNGTQVNLHKINANTIPVYGKPFQDGFVSIKDYIDNLKFISLQDTPNEYTTSDEGKYVKVENGKLVFADIVSIHKYDSENSGNDDAVVTDSTNIFGTARSDLTLESYHYYFQQIDEYVSGNFKVTLSGINEQLPTTNSALIAIDINRLMTEAGIGLLGYNGFINTLVEKGLLAQATLTAYYDDGNGGILPINPQSVEVDYDYSAGIMYFNLYNYNTNVNQTAVAVTLRCSVNLKLGNTVQIY